jgi:hypothetical protein
MANLVPHRKGNNMIDKEKAAHIAEITIVITIGKKTAEEVVELLAEQRRLIAKRIREMKDGE